MPGNKKIESGSTRKREKLRGVFSEKKKKASGGDPRTTNGFSCRAEEQNTLLESEILRIKKNTRHMGEKTWGRRGGKRPDRTCILDGVKERPKSCTFINAGQARSKRTTADIWGGLAGKSKGGLGDGVIMFVFKLQQGGGWG